MQYGQAEWTAACVNSLRTLNYSRREVVLVDNASPDDAADVIASRYPEVHVVRSSENNGFAAACNMAARHASELGCEILWLLNNDTQVFPDSLCSMLAVLGPGVGAVGSVLLQGRTAVPASVPGPDQRFAPLQQWGGGLLHRGRGETRHNLSPDHPPDFLSGASLLLRAETYRDLGGLHEPYYFYFEDVELCLRLQASGAALTVADASLVLHRESATSARGAFQNYHYSRAHALFCRRNCRSPARAVVLQTVRRCLRRFLRGQCRSGIAVGLGAWDGWRERSVRKAFACP